MRISLEKLLETASTTGFRPEILEKAIQLMHLLHSLPEHPYLKGRLALRGGSALNLFYFELPRLSVDIDLDYIGAVERDAMIAERPVFERAIEAVCSREGFAVRRIPEEHAGGKWLLRYDSAYGQKGNLELDMNYGFRVQLWPINHMDSHRLGPYQASGTPLVCIHEIAAGKLAALLSRGKARDLFDCHQLLHTRDIDREHLRIAFVAYGGMNRRDWRTVSIEDVTFDEQEFERQLVPTLHSGVMTTEQIQEFGMKLVTETRDTLSALLPFSPEESEFLDRLLDKGEIDPEFITDDPDLQDRIKNHPWLKWKALNVKEHHNI